MFFIAALLSCTLVAIDGDTLRCGRERIRLIGIDAPELPGHCRTGRQCVPGDAARSKATLERAIVGPVSIRRVGLDRYGRTLAAVTVGATDLSCAQLGAGSAVYVRRWDTQRIIAQACPSLIRR